jgi:hypothetical protein
VWQTLNQVHCSKVLNLLKHKGSAWYGSSVGVNTLLLCLAGTCVIVTVIRPTVWCCMYSWLLSWARSPTVMDNK